MFRRCFDIFPGIGPATAARFRESGITSWDQALADSCALPVGRARRAQLRHDLARAMVSYSRADAAHFDGLLSAGEAWRLFSSFPERCAFFDIETTGLSPYTDDITVICTYEPGTRTLLRFVKDENLERFPETLRAGAVLVGFNSRSFDMPFVRRVFGDRMPPFAQIDLRWVLHKMGIKGGLKAIESEHFGIARPVELDGFDGEQAVWAWHRWRRTGDRAVLDRLLLYCQADVIVLDRMLREICRRKGCPRFSCAPPAGNLFATPSASDWASAMPELPPPV